MIIEYNSIKSDNVRGSDALRCSTLCPNKFVCTKKELQEYLDTTRVMVGSAVCQFFCIYFEAINHEQKKVNCKYKEEIK